MIVCKVLGSLCDHVVCIVDIFVSSDLDFVILFLLEFFVFLKENQQLFLDMGRQVLDRIDLISAWIELLYWDCDNLRVFTFVVYCVDHTDDFALDQTPGEGRVGYHDSDVDWISILRDRLWDKPIVKRVEHTMMQHAIELVEAHMLIVLIFIL